MSKKQAQVIIGHGGIEVKGGTLPEVTEIIDRVVDIAGLPDPT